MPSEPTTILNFEVVLDEILAAVNNISSSYVTVDQFNSLLALIREQTTILNSNSVKLDAISVKIDSLIGLWQSLLAALNDVGTLSNQTQILAVLAEMSVVLAGLAGTLNNPVRISGAPETKLNVSQPVPTLR